MCKVIQYPTEEDKVYIHSLIQFFAQGYITRQKYMDLIAGVLESYNIKKIHMNGYKITLEKYEGMNIIILEGNEICDYCPGCKSTLYRYVRTREENLEADHDCITVACFCCGSVYDTFGYKTLENLEGGI